MYKRVSISKSNSKMGAIQSVSLPPIVTCIKCECNKLCYAWRMVRRGDRKNCKNAYENNLNILKEEPEKYWREVESAVMAVSVFRFHVSGDIVDDSYFGKMVEIAERHKHCQILCFTKKFDIVNRYIEQNGELPENLHLIFSGWKGLQMSNPFSLPECHVLYKDGSTTAHDDRPSWLCNGNCFTCYENFTCHNENHKENCFNLKKGEQILIKQH